MSSPAPFYVVDLQTGDIVVTTLAAMEQGDVLSTVLLSDGSTMIQQALRDQQKKKALAKKTQAKLGLIADNDPDRFNQVGGASASAKNSNPWGGVLKKTTTIQDVRGDICFLDIASQSIGEVKLSDCIEGGVVKRDDTKHLVGALQDEAKLDAINSHIGPMLHTLSGTGGQWAAQGAKHTQQFIGHTPAAPKTSQANPSDQYSGSHTTHTQSNSGAKVVEKDEAYPSPNAKTVIFTNKGQDPAMKDAELFYENTKYGPLGHGSNPMTVTTYQGHRWFIVANGVYTKQFNVTAEDTQTYEI